MNWTSPDGIALLKRAYPSGSLDMRGVRSIGGHRRDIQGVAMCCCNPDSHGMVVWMRVTAPIGTQSVNWGDPMGMKPPYDKRESYEGVLPEAWHVWQGLRERGELLPDPTDPTTWNCMVLDLARAKLLPFEDKPYFTASWKPYGTALQWLLEGRNADSRGRGCVVALDAAYPLDEALVHTRMEMREAE